MDDINNDGLSEIVVGCGTESPCALWVYNCYGSIMQGWPQLDYSQSANSNSSIYDTAWGYGVFGDGISIGNTQQLPCVLTLTATVAKR